MVKRTKAETEKFYRDLLAEHAQSGLSQKAFAASKGVPAGTLSCWRHQIKTRDAARAAKKRKKAKPQFVPVSVVSEPAPPVRSAPEPMTNSAPYEIDFGHGRVLRVPADFDDARVAALVKVVASC